MKKENRVSKYISYENSMSVDIYKRIIKYLKEKPKRFEGKIILDVTFKFEPDKKNTKFGTLSGSVDDKWSSLTNFYNHVSRNVLQNSGTSRRKFEKPIVYAFMEPSGHKLANKIGKIIDLHFHTVWILDENDRYLIEKVKNELRLMGILKFTDIFIQDVIFDRYFTGNIRKILSYNSKFQRLLQDNPKIAISYDIFPRRKNAQILMVQLDEDDIVPSCFSLPTVLKSTYVELH